MADLYFSEAGDIAVGHDGDLSLTQTPWRDDAQQAYIRVMTDIGDYLLYPDLGASLVRLRGMPQSPATGKFGVDLIMAALQREARFVGKNIHVDPVPTGYQSIRFDISITSGNREQLLLSVEQDLGIGVA